MEQATPGRPRNTEREALQKRLNISKRQANRMVKAGVTPEKADNIESARLNKLNLEAALLTEKLAILQRDHVPAAKVREDSIAAGSVFKAELSAMEINLPPLLEGLQAGEMRNVIAGYIGRVLKDLCDRIEAIA